MRWVVMPRRRPWLMLTAAAAVLILAFWVLKGLLPASGLEREALLAEALEKTRASESYRFRIDSRLETPGEEPRYFSKVEGATVVPGRTQIKGTLINSPIELVQIDDTTYMRDQITGKWMVLKGNRLAQSELFITELNPLALFNFKDVPEVSYEGRDGRIGRTNEILTFSPMVMNPFLEMQFVNFDYRLWIDSRDHLITKAQVSAESKSAQGQRLLLDIELWDHNGKIVIEPPDTAPEEKKE